MIWGIVFALLVARMEGTGIYTIFQTLMAFFQGPALAVLLCGFLWKRASAQGAFVGFLGGVAAAVGLFTLNQETVYTALGWQPLFRINDPFLYFSVWAFLISMVLVIAVSLLTVPDPSEKTDGLVYSRSRRTAS